MKCYVTEISVVVFCTGKYKALAQSRLETAVGRSSLFSLELGSCVDGIVIAGNK